MRANGIKNGNNILHGDQTVLEEIFTGSTARTALAENFCVTGMLTRDLFAVANLVYTPCL